MDCTDMVIGVARGSASRVFDYYTRDRSTPRRDEDFWGGSDDLTAAVGFERDGETTILFRKKLNGGSGSDHPIVNDDMHVIWAVGQDEDNVFHKPDSGLEAGPARITDFYRADEIKYHGRKRRGSLSLNFFEAEVKQAVGSNAGSELDFCGGEWKYPRSCQGDDCEYRAKWRYDENEDAVDFTVETSHAEKWTGIGFSSTPQMSRTDAVIGYVESADRVTIMDMWTSSYLSPVLDQSQDLTKKVHQLHQCVH